MEAYLGEIRTFAGDFAPENWVLCNGQLLNISDYFDLYSIIGTTFGGDGRKTFGTPNLSGALVVSTGPSPGASTYSMYQTGGAENVALSPANMPSHTHTMSVARVDASTDQAAGNYLAAPVDTGNAANSVVFYYPDNSSDKTQIIAPLPSGVIGSAGGAATPHENRQPFISLSYIMCAQGLYPGADQQQAGGEES